MASVVEVTDEEVQSLTQSILVRYGIDFTCYEPKSLKRRIIRVISLHDMASIHDLWTKFLRDPSFVQTFMNQISVGMTSMFRDPVLWKTLKKRVPVDFDKDSLSIWHAGCSTGEEVFSMGILLRELHYQNRAKAFCSDINLDAIEEARAGVYHKIKNIENEANYAQYNPGGTFSQYYTGNGHHVQMDTSLLAHCSFSYHNLITDPFSQQFDVVFCRNVMIYFDHQTKVKLLSKFHGVLRPGGYLIIGFFDTMAHLIDGRLFTTVDEQAKIFRKT